MDRGRSKGTCDKYATNTYFDFLILVLDLLIAISLLLTLQDSSKHKNCCVDNKIQPTAKENKCKYE